MTTRAGSGSGSGLGLGARAGPLCGFILLEKYITIGILLMACGEWTTNAKLGEISGRFSSSKITTTKESSTFADEIILVACGS